jgi:hypothetical protein
MPLPGIPPQIALFTRLAGAGVNRPIWLLILCVIDLFLFTVFAFGAYLLTIILPPIYGHAQILYYLAFIFALPAAWAFLVASTISFGSGNVTRVAIICDLSALIMLALVILGVGVFHGYESANFIECVQHSSNLSGADFFICTDQIAGAWLLWLGVGILTPICCILCAIVRTVDLIFIIVKARSVPATLLNPMMSAQNSVLAFLKTGRKAVLPFSAGHRMEYEGDASAEYDYRMD